MFLHELGVNVFIDDYRGFGRSQGKSTSEQGLLADGEAALAYVLSRPEVDPDSVGFYGYSLGNVVSIHLAADRFDPLFLVAEVPFASATSLDRLYCGSPTLTGSRFRRASTSLSRARSLVITVFSVARCRSSSAESSSSTL